MANQYSTLPWQELEGKLNVQEKRLRKLKDAACALSDIRMESTPGVPEKSRLIAELTDVIATQEAILKDLRAAEGALQGSCKHRSWEKTGMNGWVRCLDCGLVW